LTSLQPSSRSSALSAMVWEAGRFSWT